MSGATRLLFFVAMVSDYRAADLHGLAENGVILADGSELSNFQVEQYVFRRAKEAVA
jgi:hypothetical protein